MHRNINITGNPISTFHNAGTLNFWRLEDVDNQHCYSYKNTFTFTGKEKDSETGFSYFGARYLDHTLTNAWLSVDPMSDKYPSISPYAYCAWNPLKLVDPDGEEISTHTDEEGNVLAVYNDGNLGIYVHSKLEIQAYKNGIEFTNDYELLVGSTLHENSFKPGDKINFSSNAAEQWMNHFEEWVSHACFGKKDGIVKYGLLARNNQIFDPKSYMKYGSQIGENTYISPRDLGNYAAGRIGKLLGFSKKEILARYGAFQLSGNNIGELFFSYSRLYKTAFNYPANKEGHLTYGETPISNYFQRLGYEGINSIGLYIQKNSLIWKD